jgi:putative SOS response-associated peptidase YedK
MTAFTASSIQLASTPSMCGRFTLRTPTPVLMRHSELESMPELPLRYNIAPTQPVAAVRPDASGREFAELRWGLVPSWAKDVKMGARMINARAESVAEKPAFRSAFRRRRCIVMADGYYEWQATNGKKQPYYIRLASDEPIGFAGLWEHWVGPGGASVESCTLVTTDANEFTRPIHDRMPVILSPVDYELWLDRKVEDQARLEPLLAPSTLPMRADRVSTFVNKPMNDAKECIEPLE